MFANALRSQARLALVACRVPVARAASQLVQRSLLAPALPASRTFSTSFLRLYEGGFEDSRPVRRSNPPSNIIFIGNLPWSVEEGELREKFAPFGAIESIRIAVGPDGRSRGFGHIEFSSQADALKAFKSAEQEPFYIGDRDIRVDFAAGKQVSPPNSKLYFNNFGATEDELRHTLSEYENDIVSIYFLRNPETGEVNGSGFIEFTSIDNASDVLNKFNGVPTPTGSRLVLEFARAKRERRDTTPKRRSGGEFSGGNRDFSRRSNDSRR